jgi:3'(2'), 5'-bisphosphate nucleotidase
MNDQELAEHLALETGKLLQATYNDNHASLTQLELGALGDQTGHEFLIHELSKHRPLDHVLSEEGEDNSGRLAANRVWIIDPLDGTSHYSKGEPDYAVHIALWEKGSSAQIQLVAASVSVPETNSVHGLTNELVSSDNDSVRVLVSATRPPVEIDQICEELKAQFGQVELIAMGSVGAKLSQIIKGNADLYINTGGFFEWDIAAPAAVAKANNLMACHTNGAELTFNNPEVYVPNVVMGKPQFVQAVIKSLA